MHNIELQYVLFKNVPLVTYLRYNQGHTQFCYLWHLIIPHLHLFLW
jgi:hypothetical protein